MTFILSGQLTKPTIEEPKWRRQLAERIKQNRERKDSDDWVSPSAYVQQRSSGSPNPSSSTIFHRSFDLYFERLLRQLYSHQINSIR